MLQGFIENKAMLPCSIKIFGHVGFKFILNGKMERYWKCGTRENFPISVLWPFNIRVVIQLIKQM